MEQPDIAVRTLPLQPRVNSYSRHSKHVTSILGVLSMTKSSTNTALILGEVCCSEFIGGFVQHIESRTCVYIE